jgi:hypothetical protein
MTKWHIDPTYDPMQDLEDCKQNIEMLKGNVLQVAAAYNDQSAMIQQLINQNRGLVSMMADLSIQLQKYSETK